MPQPEPAPALTPDRVLGLLVRRKWWIAAITCVVALATLGVLRVLPKRYVSSATIQLEQQSVSQRFVASDAPTNIPELITSVSRQIMSRARLIAIIEEFKLFPDRQGARPDLLAQQLRDEIEIEPVDIGPGGVYSAFKVSFGSEDPQLAMDVATRLASLYIQESAQTRTSRAKNTASFMNEALDQARARLAAQDARIRSYKAQHLNELPDRSGSNAGAATDLRIQLQNNAAELRRAEDQQAALLTTITERIARLKQDRSELLARYTSQHPQVVRKEQEIDRWDGLLRSLQSGAGGGEIAGAAGVADDPLFAQIKRQVEARPAEVARLMAEERRIRTELAQVQSGMNQAPIREQELTGLTREYELISEEVRELERQRLQSAMTEEVEVNQQGQRFRILDAPTLPIAPSSPDRLKIGGGGLAVGLLLGLAVAFLFEMRDTSFHSERDIKNTLKVPVVIAIPLLLDAGEQRMRRVKAAASWAALVLVVSALAAAEYYVILLNG